MDKDELVKRLREKVNASPVYQSLFYDLNLLPEQIGDDLGEWAKVETIVNHFEQTAPTTRAGLLEAAEIAYRERNALTAEARIAIEENRDVTANLLYGKADTAHRIGESIQAAAAKLPETREDYVMVPVADAQHVASTYHIVCNCLCVKCESVRNALAAASKGAGDE
jgi:hypothetical protein